MTSWLFWLSMFNLGMICVLAFQLYRNGKRYSTIVAEDIEHMQQIVGMSLLVALLIDRSAGMISCDVCGASVRRGDHLRVDMGPDEQVLAHADCVVTVG